MVVVGMLYVDFIDQHCHHDQVLPTMPSTFNASLKHQHADAHEAADPATESDPDPRDQ